MLPTYIIAGTVRSGTTSLHRWLAHHPEVTVAPMKEVRFFDREHDRGLGWYESLFEAAEPGQAVGEASPNYLYDPVAVERIAAAVPGVRIVVALRDPVERAYSQYWMQRGSGHEPLDFRDAVAAEPDRLASANAEERGWWSYVDRGRYLGQLQRLARHFPAEQVKIVLYEDVRDRPEETYDAVCEFVGVTPGERSAELGERANQHRAYRSDRVRAATQRIRRYGRAGKLVAHAVASVNSTPTDYPPMPADVRARLLDEYAVERGELATLLGRDLHEWAVPATGARG